MRLYRGSHGDCFEGRRYAVGGTAGLFGLEKVTGTADRVLERLLVQKH